MIPLVCRYNGTVFDKSLKLLNQLLPEIPDAYFNKHCCLAVARVNEDARLNYTSLYKTALKEGTIGMKHNGRKVRATIVGTAQPPPGLGAEGARQEGEARSNAGTDGLPEANNN